MKSNRWKLIALSAVSGLILAACEDIIVNVLDRTAPELAWAHTGRTPARFTDGREVTLDNPVMPGQTFTLQPARASETTTLIPVARDHESAIRSMSGVVELSFTCEAYVIGGWVTKDVRTSFSDYQVTPDAAGAETKDTEGFTISYTLNDAWQRAGCDRWGQIIDVHSGRMRNIRGVLRSTAFNNAQPILSASFVTSFSYPSSYSISY